MLVIAGLAPPLYVGCEGWKVGCLPMIFLVWVFLVVAPLCLMILMGSRASDETAREHAIGLFGALAIVGYLFSIFISMIGIGLSRPWFR
jgi:hypothetical protein